MTQNRYVIRNVRQADGRLVDLTVDGELIASVDPAEAEAPAPAGAAVVDGRGRLAIPSFIDIHIHLDKALVREDLPPHDGTLRAAIEAMRQRKRRYTPEDVADRAVRLITSSVAAGATRIRTHVDVDSIVGLTALEGVRQAAAACADICEVQVVAFPQDGLVRDPRSRRLMEQAVELGVDLVGGMPHWEADPRDQRAHVDFCFALAAEADLDVDMHVDETDDERVRTLEMVADATLSRGWEGRVTAGHVCSLAGADPEYATRVIAKCRDAEMTIVANPVTNLVLQGRADLGVVRRGITRVADFRAAGVNLCFGQDNVADGFYPFGRGDMLEVALISAHAAHLTDGEGLAYVLQSITEAPARTWGDRGYGLRPGARADVLLFKAPSWEEALRLQQPPHVVLFRGHPVAQSRVETRVGRLGLEELWEAV